MNFFRSFIHQPLLILLLVLSSLGAACPLGTAELRELAGQSSSPTDDDEEEDRDLDPNEEDIADAKSLRHRALSSRANDPHVRRGRSHRSHARRTASVLPRHATPRALHVPPLPRLLI